MATLDVFSWRSKGAMAKHKFLDVSYGPRFTRNFNNSSPWVGLGFSYGWSGSPFKEFDETNLVSGLDRV